MSLLSLGAMGIPTSLQCFAIRYSIKFEIVRCSWSAASLSAVLKRLLSLTFSVCDLFVDIPAIIPEVDYFVKHRALHVAPIDADRAPRLDGREWLKVQNTFKRYWGLSQPQLHRGGSVISIRKVIVVSDLQNFQHLRN